MSAILTLHPKAELANYYEVFLERCVCCSGDGAGDRAGARAYVCAVQGLHQEDGVIHDVLQAEQGAVSLRDLQPHRRVAAAVHALQEAPLHRRLALLVASEIHLFMLNTRSTS